MSRPIRPFLSPAALDQLAAHVERQSLRDLVSVLERVRAGLSLTELERALVVRNFDAAIQAVGLEPLINALYEVQTRSNVVRSAAWESALTTFPAQVIRQPMVQLSLAAFAGENPYVMARIQQQDLRRIQDIKAETETAIREMLTRSLGAGTPPAQVARQIRNVVGLNRRQAVAVETYRARLMAEELRPEQIARSVERYSAKQLRQRAENIARTETMQALNDGKRLQWERLAQDGSIDSGDWEREWVVADDERLCPECAPFDGARAPIGGYFTSSEGAVSAGPTLHPRCRCVEKLTLAGFRLRGAAVA